MAESLKDPALEQLAEEVARETGESPRDAVLHALEERLARLRNGKPSKKAGEALLQDLMEISARCSALPDLDSRPADEILGYDERGAFGGW